MKKNTRIMLTIGLMFLGAYADAILPAIILIIYLIWRV